jgi:hypothetical protein
MTKHRGEAVLINSLNGSRPAGKTRTTHKKNVEGPAKGPATTEAKKTKRIVRRRIRRQRKSPTDQEANNMFAVMKHRSGNYGQPAEQAARPNPAGTLSNKVGHINDALKVSKNFRDGAQLAEEAVEQPRLKRFEKAGRLASKLGNHASKPINKIDDLTSPLTKGRSAVKSGLKVLDNSNSLETRATAAGKLVESGVKGLKSIPGGHNVIERGKNLEDGLRAGADKKMASITGRASSKLAPGLSQTKGVVDDAAKVVTSKAPKLAKVAGQSKTALVGASRLTVLGSAVTIADGANQAVNGKSREERLVGVGEVAAGGLMAAGVVFPPAGVAGAVLAGSLLVYENREGIASAAGGAYDWVKARA